MHRRRWMGAGLAGGIGLAARGALPALTLSVAGCGAPRTGAVFGGATMGTSYQVKLATALGGGERVRVEEIVRTALAEVDQAMSNYRPESELCRFNADDGGRWLPVSPATHAVLRQALLVWHSSAGAFDVSVGPLVDLWGFGARGARTQVPALEDIEQARGQVGLAGLEIAPERAAVRKTHAHTRLDLGAIAKGFALDEVARRFDAHGLDDYLIEVGGELRARGVRAKGAPWRIAIEQPLSSRRSIQRVVDLGARAIASSGDYRNFFEHEGQRFSHTIDPRTGWPVRQALAAVSVIADDAMSADALATAILVMGVEDGLQFAARNAVAAHLMVRTAGGLRELSSPAMQQHLVA